MAELRVLVTGAAGFLGRALMRRLSTRSGIEVLATDLETPGPDALGPLDRANAAALDVRDGGAVRDLVRRFRPRVLVHLAAMVDPRANRQLAFAVDVTGSENVISACLAEGVQRLVVTSSGAAYGYRHDHPAWIGEQTPLRAEPAFAYAWHKRLVEERLATARRDHPHLEQVVLRPGTVLGAGVRTPVTWLFEGRRLLRVRGGDDRFVFIWDGDVAAALEHALEGPPGLFNLAGDGALTLEEISRRLGTPLLSLPPALLRAGLRVGRTLRLTGYGPEQVSFLQYRPVLDNRRLKEGFGFRPRKSSAEAFEVYASSREVSP